MVGVRRGCRRVVLEPCETLRAVHPDASEEADLANRCGHVRREPRAGGENEKNGLRRRVKTERDEDDGADVRDSEDRPRERVPRG